MKSSSTHAGGSTACLSPVGFNPYIKGRTVSPMKRGLVFQTLHSLLEIPSNRQGCLHGTMVFWQSDTAFGRRRTAHITTRAMFMRLPHII